MTDPIYTPQNGTQLHDFTLPDETQTPRQLSDLPGDNGLLLAFIQGTWCSPCIQTLYFLARQAQSIRELGVNIAVVAVDDPHTLDAFRRTASLPLNYIIMADKEQRVRGQYGLMGEEVYFLADSALYLREQFMNPDGQSRPTPNMLAEAIHTHLLP